MSDKPIVCSECVEAEAEARRSFDIMEHRDREFEAQRAEILRRLEAANAQIQWWKDVLTTIANDGRLWSTFAQSALDKYK